MIVEDEYFRFNVHHGMDDISIEYWQDLDRIVSSALNYCHEAENQSRLERCAERLISYSRLQQECKFIQSTINDLTSYC